MATLLLDFKEVTHDEIISVKVWHVPKSNSQPLKSGLGQFIQEIKRIRVETK